MEIRVETSSGRQHDRGRGQIAHGIRRLSVLLLAAASLTAQTANNQPVPSQPLYLAVQH